MKIKIKQDQKIFFTSDTHYGHSNICKGVSEWESGKGMKARDFDTLDEMNSTIVERINETVSEDDILFHLGDWSFGGIEKIWEFRKQIRCKNIHLVLGNHDHHIEGTKILPNCHQNTEYIISDGKNLETYGDGRDRLFDVEAQELFSSVHNLLNLTIQIPTGKHTKDIKHRFVLCHYPIASWKDLSEGVVHLHGHVHLPKELKTGEGKYLDVGVDGNNLYPYQLDEVLHLLKGKERTPLILKQDHHKR